MRGLFLLLVWGVMGFGVGLWVVSAVVWGRNEQVGAFRRQLLERIEARILASPNEPWDWRYEEFEAVPYERQLWRVWQPLASFFPKDPARRVR